MSGGISGGKLPPDVIQKVVRAAYGAVFGCYKEGLGRNRALHGRVTARFVVERDGGVSNVGDGGSGLPDPAVVECVLKVFETLRFPEPEGGNVTVVYPLHLDPS